MKQSIIQRLLDVHCRNCVGAMANHLLIDVSGTLLVGDEPTPNAVSAIQRFALLLVACSVTGVLGAVKRGAKE